MSTFVIVSAERLARVRNTRVETRRSFEGIVALIADRVGRILTIKVIVTVLDASRCCLVLVADVVCAELGTIVINCTRSADRLRSRSVATAICRVFTILVGNTLRLHACSCSTFGFERTPNLSGELCAVLNIVASGSTIGEAETSLRRRGKSAEGKVRVQAIALERVRVSSSRQGIAYG